MLAKEFAKEISADRIVLGDPLKEVEKVAVCMVITPHVFRDIKEWGADLIVTHEPTFLHGNDQCDFPFYLEKKKMIEQSEMVVCRWHDASHFGEVDLVHKTFVERIGIDGEFDNKFLFKLHTPISPLALAKQIREKFDIKQPRIVGARDGDVEKIGLCLGARGDKAYFDMLSNDIDLIVAGELCEWHNAEPIRDMAQMGMQKSLIILGHAASEKDAMDDFAIYLNQNFNNKGITAKYFDCGEIYSYID